MMFFQNQVLFFALISLLVIHGAGASDVQDESPEKRAQAKTLSDLIKIVATLQKSNPHLRQLKVAQGSVSSEKELMLDEDGTDHDLTILPKTPRCRMKFLESERIQYFRGRDGRDGIPGSPGAIGKIGRPGTNGKRGPPGPGGVQYVRWGRTTCPPGASLVYKGVAGGGHYTHRGGGGNHLCMPESPKYKLYRSGFQNTAFVYASEYELPYLNPFPGNLHNYDPPCAVCHVQTRGAKMMIPAKYDCPAGWTTEYHGYLMAAHHDNRHASDYICVDENAEAVPGTQANIGGALWYNVEGKCGGALSCSRYIAGREFTCAVCTK